MARYPACDHRGASVDPATSDGIVCAALELQQRLSFVSIGEYILEERSNRRRNCPVRAQKVEVSGEFQRRVIRSKQHARTKMPQEDPGGIVRNRPVDPLHHTATAAIRRLMRSCSS